MGADPVADLIRAFGGLTAMARALGHAHVSTVQGWGERGRIPPWRMYEIRDYVNRLEKPALVEALDRYERLRPGPHDAVGCRYIIGDPHGLWRYCNRPRESGSSYCDEHRELCRASPPPEIPEVLP